MGNVLLLSEKPNERKLVEKRSQRKARRERGVRGLLEELNERDPKAGLRLRFQQYAASETARLVSKMREEANLTQAQLARVLGVHQQQISYLETGRSKRGTNFASLFEVAEACGVRLEISVTKQGQLIDKNTVMTLPLRGHRSVPSDGLKKRSGK